MYHKIRRIIAFVLVIATALSLGAFAAYNPPDSPDASAYISSYSVSIIN